MTLKMKILSVFLFIGLVPLGIFGIYSYVKSSESIEHVAFSKLEAIGSLKTEALVSYFKLIENQVSSLARSQQVQYAFESFQKSFKNYEENRERNINKWDIDSQIKKFYEGDFLTEYQKKNREDFNTKEILSKLSSRAKNLQFDYIVNNKNPLGSKHLLNELSTQSAYNDDHRKFHSELRAFIEIFGYYDLFLIDAESGEVIYTVFKEVDFATSLRDGPFKDSGLSRLFQKVLKTKGQVVMEDYSNYLPSYNGPASFVGSPIYSNDKLVGVLALQISFDKINAITQKKVGSELTLETILVGSDYKMRSDAVLDLENRSVIQSFKKGEKGEMRASYISKALEGEASQVLEEDYLGTESLISYAPLSILGVTWGIVTFYRAEEAFKSIYDMRLVFIISVSIISVIIFFLAIIFDKKVIQSLIQSISEVVMKLDKDADQLLEVSSKSMSNSTVLSESTTELAASLQETVSSMDEISAMVGRTSDNSAACSEMSHHASRLVNQGKERTEVVLSSVESISKSTEEFIQEISKSNDQYGEILNLIKDIAAKTQVINDIVFQTKLLSFNASVEAARAGDNGKGFAVVAEEVGNLASMSGKAATEISQLLENSLSQVDHIIQTTKSTSNLLAKKSHDKVTSGVLRARECIDSLNQIQLTISKLNEMIEEISVASKEQSVGVQEINRALNEMDQVTQSNSQVANEGGEYAKLLQIQSERLKNLVQDLSSALGRKG